MRYALALALVLMACGGGRAEPVRVSAGEIVDLGAPAGALFLDLASIENPGMVPFGLILSLPDGAELGRVAVFPPDQTGRYFVSVTEAGGAAARIQGVRVQLDMPEGAEVSVTLSLGAGP